MVLRNEKSFLLRLLKKDCEKRLIKAELQVKRASDKLLSLHESNSTVRRRAVVRAGLSSHCEERDRWEKRVDLVDEWIDELGR